VRESVKQRFDAARMVDDYLSVYRRICADNGTSRSPAVPASSDKRSINL
jgi:hypothetical protein